ncbi:RagB/SusD family nutrient uptake outer membrane protein [Mucilaginibacter sp. PAMB04168]|uniref:RagB/SusD family nutrient uptake outer membrane protein n=1 Tax=Mucilaginibacter sp. PAMB04168 TaxID=3138567 RepID=UPI0031F6E018
MKTKYLLRSASMIVLVAITSCSKDFLDRNPLNSVSSQIFWQSETDVQTALTGVYSRLQQNFLGYERVYLDGLSDNAFLDNNTNQGGNMNTLTTGNLSAATGGAINNLYSSPYRAISSCNFFLDNVDKAPLTDAAKNVYKAEVRFIRALAYFDLVQLFGGVPIYRTSPPTADDAKIAKSSAADVYTFINEDLDFAIANLPDDRYTGHAVRGSAKGIKVRVLLTQQRWAEAAGLAQEIISSGKFALANNYANLFKTAGQSSGAGSNNEIMFSTQYLAPNNIQRANQGMDIELGWFSLIMPYKDLIDDYEMTDGRRITESPLYNAATPYANRDPRLDLTIKLPGEVWRNAQGTVWSGSYVSQTTFIMEKYVDLSRAPFTTSTAQSTDQDYVHLRYADVLLMYAEAQNEANGPSSSVYDAVDAVRGRAGVNMPPLDRTRYSTKDLLREAIRHERRIELALEGQRYFDLKRWNIAHIKLPTLKTPAGTTLVFGTNNYLLPFQQSELDNNPQLRQNTGY